VQRPRDKAAAVKLMRKLLKKQGFAPDLLVSDRLRSYAAAMSEMGLSARYEQGLRRNNWLRIRISRRDGERKMQGSNRADQPRSFCHPHRRLQHFQVQRHLTSAKSDRGLRAVAMSTWRRKRQSAFRQQMLDGIPPGIIHQAICLRFSLSLPVSGVANFLHPLGDSATGRTASWRDSA
jgi:transposase-like protein